MKVLSCKNITYILIFFFSFNCAAARNRILFLEKRVSVLKLIVDPEKYDKKYVYAIGYLKFVDYKPRLYLYKEFSDYEINENSVLIDKSFKIDLFKYNNKFVFVGGTFDSNSNSLINANDIQEFHEYMHP